jgi:hypothetical protein
MLRSPTNNIPVGIALFISVLVAPFGVAVSQQMASLRSGESIRLITASRPGIRVNGNFLVISHDTLTLRGPNGVQSVALSDVSLLEVKRRTRRSITKSVVLGVVGGAAVGAVIGSTRLSGNIVGRIIFGAFFLGAGVGLDAGVVYGVCCSASWKPVPIPRTS